MWFSFLIMDLIIIFLWYLDVWSLVVFVNVNVWVMLIWFKVFICLIYEKCKINLVMVMCGFSNLFLMRFEFMLNEFVSFIFVYFFESWMVKRL